ncbi:MAG: hypothetical protein RLZZ385_1517 [Pseudomonadota bacterium]|jgi:ABC-type arginine/histidine transport system permease subunit
MKIIRVLLYLLLFLGTPALAQDAVIFNGGISEEERATAPNTGTKLVFFVRAGNYLANVSVTIKNAAGAEVVNTVARGPWLILNLPSGRYSVAASLPGGETQSLTIDVDGSTREYGFMFTSVE